MKAEGAGFIESGMKIFGVAVNEGTATVVKEHDQNLPQIRMALNRSPFFRPLAYVLSGA